MLSLEEQEARRKAVLQELAEAAEGGDDVDQVPTGAAIGPEPDRHPLAGSTVFQRFLKRDLPEEPTRSAKPVTVDQMDLFDK